MKSNRRGFLKFLSTAPVAVEAAANTVPEKPAAAIPKPEVKVGPHVLSCSGFCYTCNCCPGDTDGIHTFPYYYTALPTTHIQQFTEWKITKSKELW